MRTVIKMSVTDKMKKKEPIAETLPGGKARVYIGKHGKVKEKAGAILNILTSGLATGAKRG